MCFAINTLWSLFQRSCWRQILYGDRSVAGQHSRPDLLRVELKRPVWISKIFRVDATHCLHCWHQCFLSDHRLWWNMWRLHGFYSNHHVLILHNCCCSFSCRVQATCFGQPCYRALFSTLMHRYHNSRVRRMSGCRQFLGNHDVCAKLLWRHTLFINNSCCKK